MIRGNASPKMRFGPREVLRFLRWQSRALFDTDMKFENIFEDYDQYWLSGEIETDLTNINLVKNWLEDGSTVFDAGIGHAVTAEMLMKEKDLKISGIDISKVACERALKKGIHAEVRDINNGLGLESDEKYDYILLTEVIEHTLYPHKILLEAVDHVKKGVIVTIPNSAFIVYRTQLLRGYSPRQSFTHLHYWSIKDFEIFCNQLGIKTRDLAVPLPRILYPVRNMFAYAQAWLLDPATL
jgi:methionine biosynthesis protein MetW